MFSPKDILVRLAGQRPVFHSEADFQHAFAGEFHRLVPDCDIRLEFPVRSVEGVIYIDLFARISSEQLAIELKYKTRALTTSINDEEFSLADQAAQDIGRYDFFKDLSRIETFSQSSPKRYGYAIFLTNDSAYWKPPSNPEVGYANFAMSEGRVVSGTLKWGESASVGTRQNREQEIVIRRSHRLQWLPYSTVTAKRYGEFRCLCTEVGTAA